MENYNPYCLSQVADTKSCIVFATGVMRQNGGTAAVMSGTGGGGQSGQAAAGGGPFCLCVAVKRQVIIYEITRLKSRHKRLREVLLPAQAQCLNVFSEGRLCVGYQSGFTIYSLMGDQHPLCEYGRRIFSNKMVNSSNGPAAKLLAWSADRIRFNITKN